MIGVPHGTVLELRLLLVAHLGLSSASGKATLESCANNTKVTQKIQSLSNVVHLQQGFDAIYRCAEDNNIQFNTRKFKAPAPAAPKIKRKTIQGITILEPKSGRDLGIEKGDDASFQVRITKIATKCRLDGWMDPENLRNNKQENNDGPLGDISHQLPGLLLPIIVTTQC